MKIAIVPASEMNSMLATDHVPAGRYRVVDRVVQNVVDESPVNGDVEVRRTHHGRDGYEIWRWGRDFQARKVSSRIPVLTIAVKRARRYAKRTAERL